ncbi:MAG: disulfide bond formation protein B [Azoarcus sp.]|jgi:disulfide bond formation protein DsbB|nr:disulfide bond formation protein B [Azoarcus sp.]MDD2874376.1 disulfide bond formation protein B [Azoarcus sp.]MDX9836459.1 disulfide bond formation protein B [Azoarcus sp.]
MTLTRMPARPIFFALFALCSAMLGFGLYLQEVVGLHPCPMCIMQRYALLTVGLLGLIGGLHGPGAVGTRIYASLIGLTAMTGAGVAANQTWLQLNPPGIAECGPGLEYLMESFPLTEVLPMLFRGAGDCSAIDWTFLGLSLANWSLLSFSAFTVFSVWLLLRRQPR